MPGINLYTSNRLETLAGHLAEVARTPRSSPLEREIIVVQSRGMERWLSLELSRRLGVWANCAYPFPNIFVKEIFDLALPGAAAGTAFDKDVMTWRIMRLLPGCAAKKSFASLRLYLAGEQQGLRLYQLSKKIADTFEQYLTYRPEMILEWEKGAGTGWQAELWRLLRRENEGAHRAALLEAFARKAEEMPLLMDGMLPERISVFGISALPRYHLRVLETLGGYIDVNVFLLSPSREYWGDIKSEYEIQRELRKPGAAEYTAVELYLEKGNSLLASMGKIGRDLLWVLMDLDPSANPREDFTEPPEDRILGAIQSDLLAMRDRGGRGEADPERTALTRNEARADRSVSIHSCHSPMREVEVLHDHLLDLFNGDPTLNPRDILVMTPDIETYAPFVQAVFDSPGDEARRVPYAVADRRLRGGSALIEAFFAVLELAGSRLKAGSVMDILECPDVLRRFDLLPGDLERLRAWIREANIRWGADGDSKERFGLPNAPENTWRFGIERLLLGYALPGDGESLLQGILPFDGIEGADARVMGNFVGFFNTLSQNVSMLERPRALHEWSGDLSAMAEMLFLAADETRRDMQALRDAFTEFGRMQKESSYDAAVGLEVVKAALAEEFGREQEGRNFFTGAVTFCAMMPMRSIPFRVICLLGMNDAAFPRNPASTGFDLIAAEPRRGDRSKRDEDRYIFLETLISARDRLYISYVGQSLRDNSTMPPSVLVSELMDYITQGFEVRGAKGENGILDHIVTKHRIQAFSPGYFGGGDALFSYSRENHKTARALAGPRREQDPFITEPLPPAELDGGVSIADFIRFFDNPARALIQQRIGMRLFGVEEAVEEREPIMLEGLERYSVAQELCRWLLAGRDGESLFRIHRAAGRLPHGTAGEASFRALLPGVSRFAEDVRARTSGAAGVAVDVDIECGGLRLTGMIDGIYPGGALAYRYADTKAKDRLRAWIVHVMLNAAGAVSPPERRSILLCKDAEWTMEPVEGAHEILESLAGVYRRGQDEMLPFFPGASLEYADCMETDRNADRALRRAASAWAGSNYARGDAQDPYFDLGFGRVESGRLFDGRFASLAVEVFGPMLAHQKGRKR